jgi:hypothetical protein
MTTGSLAKDVFDKVKSLPDLLFLITGLSQKGLAAAGSAHG